jgi:hypothetical protein
MEVEPLPRRWPRPHAPAKGSSVWCPPPESEAPTAPPVLRLFSGVGMGMVFTGPSCAVAEQRWGVRCSLPLVTVQLLVFLVYFVAMLWLLGTLGRILLREIVKLLVNLL